ncbi:MAG: hypothetical protein AAGG48_29150, partial [Planctomycetota bacterium]
AAVLVLSAAVLVLSAAVLVLSAAVLVLSAAVLVLVIDTAALLRCLDRFPPRSAAMADSPIGIRLISAL